MPIVESTVFDVPGESGSPQDGRDTIIYESGHRVAVVPYRSVVGQSFLVGLRRTALALLRSGHAQVLYGVKFAGRTAIEISGPGSIPFIRRESCYVAARAYRPLGLVTYSVGETVTTRFIAYRLLPGTVANRALVTLPGAHPSARIDASAADYNAASDRSELNPALTAGKSAALIATKTRPVRGSRFAPSLRRSRSRRSRSGTLRG